MCASGVAGGSHYQRQFGGWVPRIKVHKAVPQPQALRPQHCQHQQAGQHRPQGIAALQVVNGEMVARHGREFTGGRALESRVLNPQVGSKEAYP